MLGFFRKYQKYFFFVITFVIIVSFTFFGTYSTLQQTKVVEKTAFTAVDGTEVNQRDLEEMALFLGTDSEDKMMLGGAWGPNFLNDGVIKKDLIEPGLAQTLVKDYYGDLRQELQSRLQKEKRYAAYEHPQAKFISAVNAWNIVAPRIPHLLRELKSHEDAATPEAFEARVNLYLAQRQFPHSALRYVLRHQQKQYNWVSPDPNLARTDLALFHYHTVSDWFGPRFTRLAAEFIINSAIIAQQRGYEVSRNEAFADLWANAELSFARNSNNPNLGVATTQEYFDEQLRRMGMDRTQAIEVWRKVMLFRKLFHDFGSSMFVDPFTINEYQDYANETVEGNLFKLPEHLQLGDFGALQKFELYLRAVSDRPESGDGLLQLPADFKNPEEVAKHTPELVQRRYLLEYSKVNKRALQAKVGVKETWEWQVEQGNWSKIVKQFSELGLEKAETEEARYAALDKLDAKTRARVDAFARARIVDEHPEWLTVALEEAPLEKRVVGIRKQGKNEIFPGLDNPQDLIDLLDQYPKSKEKLAVYSPDGEDTYRINVLDQSPGLEVLTFGEARKNGILEPMLEKYLQEQYEALRKKNPDAYKKQDGSWQPLAQARRKVAEESFANILTAIHQENQSEKMIPDYAASTRLLPFMKKLRDQFKQDPSAMETWVVKESAEPESQDKLPLATPLEEQWKVERIAYKADRGETNAPIASEAVFSLDPGQWSDVKARANGEIVFLELEKRVLNPDQTGLNEKVLQVHRLLSVNARQALMNQLMDKMNQENALSLKFMERGEG